MYVGIVVVLCLIVANLRRSQLGQRMLAVRSNERAAAAAGINVAYVKFVADTVKFTYVTPAAVEATMLSVQQLQANHDAALSQWRLEVERTRYEAERAERRYRAVEPENRLVARGLETEWEKRLHDLAAAETELRHREQQRPNPIGPEQLKRIQMLGSDIGRVWTAPAITGRDRKELLRTIGYKL